ncbi:hypothetical protein, partial [Klebsiella aerogenes]|uniref:hypothetical protein n=1 Tax=Klebsiella aerogenes TaxID=548 RepID=UPI001CC3D7D4
PKVKKVEDHLNGGVAKNLSVELTGLRKAESEVDVRKTRVKFLEDLGGDWTIKERTRWMSEVPLLPNWKPRSSRKRTRSSSRI